MDEAEARELDTRVARALGYTDVHLADCADLPEPVWIGSPPRQSYYEWVPRYSTDLIAVIAAAKATECILNLEADWQDGESCTATLIWLEGGEFVSRCGMADGKHAIARAICEAVLSEGKGWEE